jgi:hypothetical protein
VTAAAAGKIMHLVQIPVLFPPLPSPTPPVLPCRRQMLSASVWTRWPNCTGIKTLLCHSPLPLASSPPLLPCRHQMLSALVLTRWPRSWRPARQQAQSSVSAGSLGWGACGLAA